MREWRKKVIGKTHTGGRNLKKKKKKKRRGGRKLKHRARVWGRRTGCNPDFGGLLGG